MKKIVAGRLIVAPNWSHECDTDHHPADLRVNESATSVSTSAWAAT
jgi:hypothetical protein